MKLVDKFFIKILKRYKKQILSLYEKDKRNRAKKLFDSIPKKGPNSKFYGNELFISDIQRIVIGENVHFGNDISIFSEGGLEIGDNTHIESNVVISTTEPDFHSDVLPVGPGKIFKKVIIGKNVWIGKNVCIEPGTEIGEGAVIKMGTTVSGIIPALTIIGPAKSEKIGSRKEENYVEIENQKRYGIPEGRIYKGDRKGLEEIGDVWNNDRTIVTLIEWKGKKAIKKSFVNSEEGRKSLQNEIRCFHRLKTYSWMSELFETGEDYLIMEYFPNEFRLDQLDVSLWSEEKKKMVLGEILRNITQLYGENLAHCDLNTRNIFVTPDGVKFIDFETSQELEKDIPFFESYDITGKGLPSPFRTGNSCVMKEGKYGLKTIFEIQDIEHLQKIYEDYLVEKLYDISNSFFTRRASKNLRHTLRNRFIYSTFDLEFLKVNSIIAQRDIKKRLKRFGVTAEEIEDKTVLDIGSNIGSILLELVKWNPKKALGVEYDEDKVEVSNVIRNLHFKNKPLSFIQADVENEDFWKNLDEAFQIVFCLAVIGHLKNKEEFFERLSKLCSETLYFEGNSESEKEFIEESLKKSGFKNITYLGLSDDEKDDKNNRRPLFVARK